MNGNGWIGTARELQHYLRVVGADRDEEGRFKIGGAPVSSFMGMDGDDAEVVVPAETVYYIDGQPKNLAAGLASTSYGMGVKVI